MIGDDLKRSVDSADAIRPSTLLQLRRVRNALDDIAAGPRRGAQSRLAIAAPTADQIVLDDGTDDGATVDRRAS